MKHFLFITTTNLSTNPRLLKELKLASENDYRCTFIGFKLGNWSDKTEREHLKQLNGVKAIYFSALREPFLNWLFATMVWKFSLIFNKFFNQNLKLSSYAHNKRTWQLVKKLKNIKNDYDLVIAHNLGALYPAYKYAKKHHLSFAFDIEDFHPGEKCSRDEKQRRELLMQKILPSAAYISYASPLIGKNSMELLMQAKPEKPKLDAVKYMATSTKCISRSVCDPEMLYDNEGAEEIKLPDSFLINNSFGENEFQLIETKNERLQLVWFSQNITWERGLEQIVPALSKFKEKVHLHLIGNKRDDFYNDFLVNYDEFITFIEPLPQDKLHLGLSKYDIGLAIEISSVDVNKDIALSNKIFAYAQAGLYILATDTAAQKQFIEEQDRDIGLLSSQSTEEMEQAIKQLIDEVEKIRENKKARFEYAKQLAWEHEGTKLLNIWDEIFSDKKIP